MKPSARKAPALWPRTRQRSEGEFAAHSDGDLVRLAQAGSTEAREILFSRNRPLFLGYAKDACGDPIEAQDICQLACINANSHLSKLLAGEAFRAWVRRFIINEARHWKRNRKKSGTEDPEIGTYILETMCVETASDSEADLKSMLALLGQRTAEMAGSRQRVAALLVESFERDQEFPPVRAIATATHTSLGTAQRCRQEAIQAFRRTLTALGLQP